MANCSTLGKMFHEKGAQNNGEKNKVKLFFQKKMFHDEKLFHDLQNTCDNRAGPGRCK
jgi:hypothetical protein